MEQLPIQDETHAKTLPALEQCPLFRALKPEHFPQVVKLAELWRFEDEETIIRQGDPADSFFLLIEGQAAIKVGRGGESLEIGRIEPPSSVGEMGLLLGEARTATAAAAGSVLALKFGAKAFEAMFQKIPDFGLGLARGLAARLDQVSGKVNLPHYDVGKLGRPADDVVALLPIDLIQRHRVLPLKVEGSVLTLGLVDDPTPQVTNAVRALLPSLELRPVHIDSACFNEVLEGKAGVAGWQAPAGVAPKDAPLALRSPRLDALLDRVVAEGASDLHISGGHQPRWRIDGEMKTMSDTAMLGREDVLELVTPMMDERQRRQFAAENDVDMGYATDNARFRVNIFRDYRGVGAVLRQIPSRIMTFEQLNLPPVIRTFCEMPKGLVLVTGPTGSGKSTTLAAMVDYINKTKHDHIITMEDPIEFVHPSQSCLVNQREVGSHTTSFARALRACLREDPDVVLVGELRDLETIQLALETANTGHLVFGTLHTNSAISTVDRIIDQFPADQQAQVRTVLADVLKGVVSQILLRKKTGGRLAALEVLVVNQAVSALIREGKTVQVTSAMQSGKGQGMQLLNDVLYEYIDERKVEMAEAMAKAVDKDDLARRFRSGITLADDPPANARFRVVNVAPDSPGAEVGFARGDYITEIEGKAAKDLTLDEVKQKLRSDGRHVFTVERQGKRRSVTLELKRALR
jgi:twitching motility protein PilT